MAKYGKWIGAGLGLALGGPLGALFGLFIGSMFDNIQTIAIPSDGGPIPPGQTGRGDFTFSLTVLAGSCVPNSIMSKHFSSGISASKPHVRPCK